MNFIEQLLESNDEIKKKLGADIKRWSAFDHKKHDLEFMLGNVICELAFVEKDGT